MVVDIGERRLGRVYVTSVRHEVFVSRKFKQELKFWPGRGDDLGCTSHCMRR